MDLCSWHTASTLQKSRPKMFKPPPAEVCDLQSTMNQDHQTEKKDHISKAADTAAALLLQAGDPK